MANLKKFVLILTTLCALQAGAQVLSDRVTNFDLRSAFTARSEGFIYPNELNPERATQMLAKAEGNVYLAVGTERALWGFGLAPNQTHLIMADMHPRVVLYNSINLALIKASRSRQEYLQLRRTHNLADWEQAVRRGATHLARFANAQAFDFWTDKVDLFGDLNDRLFTKGNYLSDDSAFERISTAAYEGRIQVVLAAYGGSENFDNMIRELQAQNLKLGVLDFSNAWEYAGTPVNSILESCAKIALPKSLYLVTEGSDGSWQYKGVFFNSLAVRYHGTLTAIPRIFSAWYLSPFAMTDGTCERLLNRRSEWRRPR